MREKFFIVFGVGQKKNGNLSKNSEKILIQFEKFFDKAGVEITIANLEKPHY